nr:hypothetical protein [Tanacetum cinerariifolium]
MQTQTSSVLHNDTVSSCLTFKVQEKTQLSRSRCMHSLREVKSLFKFLSDSLQDFGTMPIFKRTFSQDLDLLKQHLAKDILSQTDCNTTLTNLRTKFENAFNSEFKEHMPKYTRFDAQSFKDAMICTMDSIGKYMLEIILHQQRTPHLLKHKKLMQTEEDHSNPIRALNTKESKIDSGKAINDDLVVTESSGIESEVQDDNSRSGNDTDADDANIRPIYEEEPMAEILNETSNKAKIKKEIDVLETMNIELEHSVAKLRKENESLKKHYKDLYDSIKITRTKTIEQATSLIANNANLKAQIQEKVFAIAALKNDLRKLKGNSIDTKPQISKQRFASQVDGNNNLSKPVTQHYLPKKSDSAFAKPNHMIASSSSRNSSQNMSRFSSNDMVHNYYLDEAKKKTHNRDMNSKTSVMTPARYQRTDDDSKPKPRSPNNSSRSLPISKSSCVTITAMPKADHSKSPMNSHAKIQSHKTKDRNKPVDQKSHTQIPGRQIFTGHRFSPNKTSAVYVKTSPRSDLRWKPTGRIFKSVGLRWIPTGKLFDSFTSKVDSEPPHGSNVDISKIHECIQTLDLSAGTSINVQKEQSLDLSTCTLSNVNTKNLRGIMPTKIELTLEQSQQGVSNDVLVSIKMVEELKRNVWIKGEKKAALQTSSAETRDCVYSKGNVEAKILVPKPPKNCARCTRCGYLVDSPNCQGCALLRQELEENLVTHSPDFQNTSEPSNASTNVVNAPQEPYVVKQDNGSFVDKIIFDLNRALGSPHLHTISLNQFHCFHCKDVLRDGEAYKRCTCAKCGSGLGKGLCYICGHNQNSLNDSPSISETSSQSPLNINHCCYECSDPLDGIFYKRCTSESPFTLDLTPTYVDESPNVFNSPPQSLVPFTLDSTPTYVDESPNVFNPPPQSLVYPYEICENNAYYGHYCTPQAPFIYPEPCYNQDFNLPQDFQNVPQQYPCCDDCGVTHDAYQIVIPKDEEIEDDNLHEKLLKVNLLIAKIEALKDNSTPSSEFLTKSSSTFPKSVLEETSTFDDSLPEFENFCFDLEKITSGSTTTHSDISLLDYKAFSFYDGHIKEISSGSTTTHSDISLSEYDLFIFDLSNDQCPPTDRSDFTHKEFADELAHIISPLEYDCFYFRDLPYPGEWISSLNFGTHKNLSSTTFVNLPVEDDHSPLLAYVVWIFLAYLTYPVIPPHLHSF